MLDFGPGIGHNSNMETKRTFNLEGSKMDANVEQMCCAYFHHTQDEIRENLYNVINQLMIARNIVMDADCEEDVHTAKMLTKCATRKLSGMFDY